MYLCIYMPEVVKVTLFSSSSSETVSVNPTLSIVIIPIVCGLLTLIIIALGISFCIQQRSQMAVEVANFDFHQEEEGDAYADRTFFEDVWDTILCKGARCGSPGEAEPLVPNEPMTEEL